jgi:hypothetical protein
MFATIIAIVTVTILIGRLLVDGVGWLRGRRPRFRLLKFTYKQGSEPVAVIHAEGGHRQTRITEAYIWLYENNDPSSPALGFGLDAATDEFDVLVEPRERRVLRITFQAFGTNPLTDKLPMPALLTLTELDKEYRMPFEVSGIVTDDGYYNISYDGHPIRWGSPLPTSWKDRLSKLRPRRPAGAVALREERLEDEEEALARTTRNSA